MQATECPDDSIANPCFSALMRILIGTYHSIFRVCGLNKLTGYSYTYHAFDVRQARVRNEKNVAGVRSGNLERQIIRGNIAFSL